MVPYSAEELRSRLGISTGVVANRPLDMKALEDISRAGISNLEIMEHPINQFKEDDPQTMEWIVSACKDLGLSIVSFHARFYDVRGHLDWSDRNSLETGGETQRRKEIDRCKRVIDYFISLGCKAWVTHLPIIQDATRKSYCELARHCEGQDIHLLIENAPRKEQNVSACIEWVDSISHPQIGICLDVGHECNSQKQNLMILPGAPARIIGSIGNRLHHLHLHDWISSAIGPKSPHGHDHFAPFEEGGDMSWTEIFSALSDIDYQGVFMFEPLPGKQYSENPIDKVGRLPERLAAAAG